MRINPMNIVASQLRGNPLFVQAQNMARGKTDTELKATCENLCKQMGIDLGAAMSQFQSQFPGLK